MVNLPPPPPPPPQSLSSFTAQYTHQFLTSVLSHRGSSSLPYSEDVKWLIRQHLLSLTETFPTFQPKMATFTHDDDRSVVLLQSDGTVPMVFQTVTYNIPVVIWLMETYPRQPPLVLVNPTRDMIVKRGHQFVNSSGLVSIPYLQNWVYPSSNLVYLVPILTHYFGIEPPLYSQRRTKSTFISSGSVRPEIPPRSYPASPVVVAASPDVAAASSDVATASPDVAASSSAVTVASPDVIAASSDVAAASPDVVAASPDVAAASPDVAAASPDVAAASPDVAAASPDVAAASPDVAAASPDVTVASPGSVTEDPDESYRRNAVNRLVENVHDDVEELRKKREVELEGMFNAQAVLRQREDELKKGLREMQYEKEALEQQLQMVLMNTDMLDRNARGFNADDAFEHLDLLSKQMLESTASDLAIEDVIYALDKAVQEGSVPVDLYLRNVRLLSREQFFHRAKSAKVRDVQMQAHVASMASRAPPYAD